MGHVGHNAYSRRVILHIDAKPDLPEPLYSLSWMAIRTEDHHEVAKEIKLLNMRPCNWTSANELTLKYGSIVFVSPPVNGWVFVAGNLPFEASTESSKDPFLKWMCKLSEKFSDVQFFSEDNSMPYATWSWCQRGSIKRAYAFRTDPDCSILWNVGSNTEAEGKQGYRFGLTHFEGEVKREDYHKWLPYEEATEEIAASWGLCPSGLNNSMLKRPSLGLAGQLEVEWIEKSDKESDVLSDGLPDITPEQEAAVQREIEHIVSQYDMQQLIGLYCKEKEWETPESLKHLEVSDFEELIKVFADILKTNQMIDQMSDDMVVQMAAMAAGMALRHYRDQLKPRKP